MNNKTRAVYSASLARQLIGKKYVVRDIKPNPENKSRTIFFFDDTDEINKIITEFAKR